MLSCSLTNLKCNCLAIQCSISHYWLICNLDMFTWCEKLVCKHFRPCSTVCFICLTYHHTTFVLEFPCKSCSLIYLIENSLCLCCASLCRSFTSLLCQLSDYVCKKFKWAFGLGFCLQNLLKNFTILLYWIWQCSFSDLIDPADWLSMFNQLAMMMCEMLRGFVGSLEQNRLITIQLLIFKTFKHELSFIIGYFGYCMCRYQATNQTSKGKPQVQ